MKIHSECSDVCQHAESVGLWPQYRCSGKCQYLDGTLEGAVSDMADATANLTGAVAGAVAGVAAPVLNGLSRLIGGKG